jgi:hypothetical protein
MRAGFSRHPDLTQKISVYLEIQWRAICHKGPSFAYNETGPCTQLRACALLPIQWKYGASRAGIWKLIHLTIIPIMTTTTIWYVRA